MYKQLLRKYKNAPVTSTIIGICIVVYLISFILYGEEMNVIEGIHFGGYNPILVNVYHEYYRLITANFIHFGVLHIVMNCYSLYGLGMFIEMSLKTKKYIIVCLVSMISTTCIPYVLFLINGFEANTLSGGISGMIFGLIGALGALALSYKNIFMDVFKQLFPNVLLMLMLSFVVPSISLSGHVSGMIGGFVSAYIILSYRPRYKENKSDLLN